jgi:hypothetical protein
MVSATSLRAARKVLGLASDLAREELLKALAQNPRFKAFVIVGAKPLR